MIKFETEKTVEDRTFADVELDQFFIDRDGDLMQKESSDSANKIASCNGRPSSVSNVKYRLDQKIVKVLPRVIKITWE